MNGQFGSLTAAAAAGNFIKENNAPWSTSIYLDLINEETHSSFALTSGLINAFSFD